MVPVIFRKYNSGEVIALFPTLAGYKTYCTSYSHIGQHGIADYGFVVQQTIPATEEESKDLKQELVEIGYNMKVYRRRQPWMSQALVRNIYGIWE